MHSRLSVPLACVVVLCACPMDDDDGAATPEPSSSTSSEPTSSEPTSAESTSSESTSDSSTTDPAPPTYTVSGTVTRLATAPIAPGNDGIGTLYIGAFTECGHGQPPVGVFALPDADFSSETNVVPWSIADLPAGPIHFGLFLDDDLDAVLPAAEPDAGDPSYADDVCDGVLSCMSFEIDDADVIDAALVLNLTHTECP